MALSEQEEFELLSLRRRRAMSSSTTGDAPSSNAAVDAAFGKPAKEIPGIASRLSQAALKGSLPFGPIGALAGAVSEGTDIGNEALTKGAYEAGGAVTDITGSPEAGFAANVMIQAAPSIATMSLGRTPSLTKAPATRLMQSAAVPDKATRMSGDAQRAISRMLEKDINATRGGMESQIALRNALETKIQDILKGSQGRVDPNNVAIKTLKDSLSKITYNVDPVADMKVIDDSINTFLRHPQVEGLGTITVETANKLKQGIYAELRAARTAIYGQGLGKLPTEIMADKSRAAVLREAVATAEPKVVPSLAEQAEAINVIKTLEPQVSREGNKMMVGIGMVSPTMERTIAWMLDRYPWFKSFLARATYTAGKHAPAAAITAGTATQGQK